MDLCDNLLWCSHHDRNVTCPWSILILHDILYMYMNHMYIATFFWIGLRTCSRGEGNCVVEEKRQLKYIQHPSPISIMIFTNLTLSKRMTPTHQFHKNSILSILQEIQSKGGFPGKSRFLMLQICSVEA